MKTKQIEKIRQRIEAIEAKKPTSRTAARLRAKIGEVVEAPKKKAPKSKAKAKKDN